MARRYRLLAGLALAVTVALIAPAPASALPNPTDLLPSLPSVGDILESILKKLVDLVVPKEVSRSGRPVGGVHRGERSARTGCWRSSRACM